MRVLVVLTVSSLTACGNDGGAPADGPQADGEVADARTDAGTDAVLDAPQARPALGVYVMNVDGTGLTMLTDPGTRALTHVRQLAGTDWMTATRYSQDLDGNGLAMELEAPVGAFYGGAQIVVFQRSSPTVLTEVTQSITNKIAANSSWTADGKLIFIQQDDPNDPNLTRLKRVTFTTLPAPFVVDTIPIPTGLFLPVDPHQVGTSDDSGSIVFPALYQHTSGWMRPVWKIPAGGTTSFASATLVGCPICPANNGCCAFPTIGEVLGTNDPRFNHAGTEVMWMHQHPDVSFDLGSVQGNPMRPHMRVLANATPIDLTPPGVAATTSVSFGEYSPDDSEVVYWTMQIEGAALKHHLFRMAPDGTQRQQIPLPDDLCPSHPSYLSATQIVFSAFRCLGASCTCSV